MKGITLTFLLALSFSAFSELAVVDADRGSDLLPKIEGTEEDRKLELPKKSAIHPEVARIIAELGISGAIIEDQLENADDNTFMSNKKDIKSLVREFSKLSYVFDNLDEGLVAERIKDGAKEIKPEKKADCVVSPKDNSAPCDGKIYVKEETNQLIPELHGISEITPDNPKIGIAPIKPKEERNVIILTLTRTIKERRENLEKLVKGDFLSEIQLEELASLKRSFASYREKMGRFITKTSKVSNTQGQCEIIPGALKVDCFDEKFVLIQGSPIGEQPTKEVSQSNLSRDSHKETMAIDSAYGESGTYAQQR